MDDFLHNLRSGKLKQQDRSNRPYNDQQYKGGQRRPMMDRRKKDMDSKESVERLAALKEVVENLADTQKRIAEATEARNLIEERKTIAMEVLAKNIYQMLNPNADNIDTLFSGQIFAKATPVRQKDYDDTAGREEMEETVIGDVPHTAPARGHKLTADSQKALYPMINQMRDKGDSWERIARHIADQGWPTISGKGQWRGVMVKNLFEKLSAR